MGRIVRLLGTLLAVAATGCNPGVGNKAQGQSFEQGLKAHLEAVENRDINKLGPTVGKDVTMIGPDGDIMESKIQFMEFHRNWFKMDQWEWKAKILETKSNDSLGYGLVKYRYTEKDSTGAQIYGSDAYLVLVFQNSGNGWQLVHDQNTRIAKDPE